MPPLFLLIAVKYGFTSFSLKIAPGSFGTLSSRAPFGSLGDFIIQIDDEFQFSGFSSDRFVFYDVFNTYFLDIS